MTLKQKYDYALDRMIDLLRFGMSRERELELELELAKAKKDLRHMEECYLDAKTEIAQLRSDLYREIGSTSS